VKRNTDEKQLNQVKFQGTKYLGGHSDLLCGVLVVKTGEEWKQVKSVGNVMLNSVSYLSSCNMTGLTWDAPWAH